jgi:hypothetical protein
MKPSSFGLAALIALTTALTTALTVQLPARATSAQAGTGSGSGADGVADHPCASVVLPTDRLACFDRAFPPPAAVRVETERALQVQAEQAFGRRGPPPEAGASASAAPSGGAAPERLEAVLTAVERSSAGLRTFTLDNGQRWRETELTSRGQLREGDTVVIERATFGTFLLVTPARVGLRVRRLP